MHTQSLHVTVRPRGVIFFLERYTDTHDHAIVKNLIASLTAYASVYEVTEINKAHPAAAARSNFPRQTQQCLLNHCRLLHRQPIDLFSNRVHRCCLRTTSL